MCHLILASVAVWHEVLCAPESQLWASAPRKIMAWIKTKFIQSIICIVVKFSSIQSRRTARRSGERDGMLTPWPSTRADSASRQVLKPGARYTKNGDVMVIFHTLVERFTQRETLNSSTWDFWKLDLVNFLSRHSKAGI